VRVRRTAVASAPIGVVVFTLVSCTGDNDDWRFSARVVGTDAETVCLALVDDGPGYINNDCLDRSEVVGMPDDIRDGECLRLNQKLHADLIYEGRGDC
jgi:hypothetical protein